MINNEFSIFLSFVLIGLIIGFLFDFFRILRRSYETPDSITIVEDIVFWLISGLLLLIGIFVLNEGKIRAYLFLGLFAGIFIYIATLSKYIMKVGTKFFKIFNTYIIKPLQKVMSIIVKILIKLIKNIFKIVKNIKFLNKNTKKRGIFNLL